jgi:hypothetical protein
MAAWWLVPHAKQHHALDGLRVRVGEAHLGAVDVAGFTVEAPAEGVLEGARLLEDLLQHEVLVAGLLGHGGRPVDALHGAVHRGTGHRGDRHAAGLEHGHLAVLHEQHVARVGQQRGHVAGAVGGALADAQHQRRRVLGHHDAPGLEAGQHRDGVGPVQARERAAHGRLEVLPAVHLAPHQVGHQLGVGVREDLAAGRAQLGAQGHVVLDDAVVHHGHRARDVRVRVHLARAPVRGPARVADAYRAIERPLLEGALQVAQLAHGADHLDAARAVDGQARRVVAAVLEAPQAVEQDGGRRFVTDVSDNAAHARDASRPREGAHRSCMMAARRRWEVQASMTTSTMARTASSALTARAKRRASCARA